MLKFITICMILFGTIGYAASFEEVNFPSKDGLIITGDLYFSKPKTAPFILLFHRAGWSRGEYREIAPKLLRMGFNCLAIDQRSGGKINEVLNETYIRAVNKKIPTTWIDALPDLEASIKFAKENFATGKLIIWGSSYSSSLVIKIAGDQQDSAHGVLAFAPGEYFNDARGATFIQNSAKNINIPIFITSAKSEKDQWAKIFDIIPSREKVDFLPNLEGVHGSSALWQTNPSNNEYWEAVTPFLQRFL